MPFPTTWQTVTGNGTLDFGGWQTVNTISTYIELSGVSRIFTENGFPRSVRHAGGMGLVISGDTDPFGGSLIHMSFFRWFDFEYDVWWDPGHFPLGSNGTIWKLPNYVTLHYILNA